MHSRRAISNHRFEARISSKEERGTQLSSHLHIEQRIGALVRFSRIANQAIRRRPQRSTCMSIREAISALSLQGSETEVMHAASRIFAALIAAGRLTETNQDEMVEFAVRAAVDLARQTDVAIQSEGEAMGLSAFGT